MNKIIKVLKKIKVHKMSNVLLSSLAVIIITAAEMTTSTCVAFIFGQEDMPEDIIE